jgi:hypothetical protein
MAKKERVRHGPAEDEHISMKVTSRKLWGLAILALVGAIAWQPILTAYLNLSGVCIAEGRKLSDEEIIANVIHEINSMRWINVDEEPEPRPIVPYPNLDSFIALNPDCCQLALEGPHELPPPKLWQQLKGLVSRIITLDYNLTYTPTIGEDQRKRIRQVFFVTNCGELYLGDD